jgi:hypothetical protein
MLKKLIIVICVIAFKLNGQTPIVKVGLETSKDFFLDVIAEDADDYILRSVDRNVGVIELKKLKKSLSVIESFVKISFGSKDKNISEFHWSTFYLKNRIFVFYQIWNKKTEEISFVVRSYNFRGDELNSHTIVAPLKSAGPYFRGWISTNGKKDKYMVSFVNRESKKGDVYLKTIVIDSAFKEIASSAESIPSEIETREIGGELTDDGTGVIMLNNYYNGIQGLYDPVICVVQPGMTSSKKIPLNLGIKGTAPSRLVLTKEGNVEVVSLSTHEESAKQKYNTYRKIFISSIDFSSAALKKQKEIKYEDQFKISPEPLAMNDNEAFIRVGNKDELRVFETKEELIIVLERKEPTVLGQTYPHEYLNLFITRVDKNGSFKAFSIIPKNQSSLLENNNALLTYQMIFKSGVGYVLYNDSKDNFGLKSTDKHEKLKKKKDLDPVFVYSDEKKSLIKKHVFTEEGYGMRLSEPNYVTKSGNLILTVVKSDKYYLAEISIQ